MFIRWIVVYQAPVVRKVDSVIHWISYYQLDSDLSGGQRYQTFEQPGRGQYSTINRRRKERIYSRQLTQLEWHYPNLARANARFVFLVIIVITIFCYCRFAAQIAHAIFWPSRTWVTCGSFFSLFPGSRVTPVEKIWRTVQKHLMY